MFQELFTLWISTFGLIFALIDPFGFIPLFLSMTIRYTQTERVILLKRACIIAFLVLVVFLLLGNTILHFFGITIPALQLSGGMILFVTGWDMLRTPIPQKKLSVTEEKEAQEKADISVVPLAIPMLSGPASIVGVTVLASKNKSVLGYVSIILSILVTLAIIYLVLNSAWRILNRVGTTGLHVMTRVMGLLLCAMAIQFIMNVYTQFVHT